MSTTERKEEKVGEQYPKKLQKQEQEKDSHGAEHKMVPQPHTLLEHYKGADKLKDMVAIITGGDSGIGRSVAILYAREGADICIIYHTNDKDAEDTKKMVEREGRKCLSLKGDICSKSFCAEAVKTTVERFGRLDILVNNAAVQFEQEHIQDISEKQLDTTFRTNIYSMFFMTQAAVEHLEKSPNPSIINNTSINAWKGHPTLIDYTATKGAIVGFTRSLAQNLVKQNIRVNMVAPGPIWTPLIPSSFSGEKIEQKFGKKVPMERPGQPEECAGAFVFLAAKEASYISGQVIHVNGGVSY